MRSWPGRRVVARLALLVAMLGPAAPAASGAAADWWHPGPDLSWQIQLNNPPEPADLLAVEVYDVDLFETEQATIDEMHERGIKVICYFSAGSYENWRPDRHEFRDEAIGKPLDGWPGERWLDIRSDDVRAIMRERLDQARSTGCDAVDPDNVDAYSNRKTGFNLTAADQLEYNRFLADEAHARGLAVGLKNDAEQIDDLVDSFDFAVNEECFRYDECETLRPFLDDGKPVFQIEYGTKKKARKICPDANAFGFQTLIKKLKLDAKRIACRDR